MPFLEECEVQFGTRDLYEVLSLSKEASAGAIKKAYRKLSLKTHPDRATDSNKESATAKFQVLGAVYNILSDAERRAVYDETGIVDDITDKILDWGQFWKSVFPGLTAEFIIEHTDKYWGSSEERQDLKKNYEKFAGNMDKIMENMYSRVLEHEPKYRQMIETWIEKGEVESFRAFTHESKAKKAARKRKYEREAKEAKTIEKNAKTFQREVGDSLSSLESIIAQRNEVRMKRQDAFLDDLAAKYVKPKKSKAKNGGMLASTSKRRSTKK